MSTSMGMSTSTRTTIIPAPRRAADDEIVEAAPAPKHPAARSPWPEPWRSYRGARPRTEFWDEASATWLSRGPVSG